MKLAIIPARYDSSRFPGKPLAGIHGKPMIERVYDAVRNAHIFDHIVVATDDNRIFNAVESFGGNVMMTSQSHRSGTDRCIEIVEKFNAMNHHFDIVVNIQGDEPGIRKEQIQKVIQGFNNPKVEIVSLYKKIEKEEEIRSPNVVKCVFSNTGNALYFSRLPIPYQRNMDVSCYYKHIGIYAYRNLTLRKIKTLKASSLEVSESLEQLRWLQNDISIQLLETNFETRGIDTPDDLLAFNRAFQAEK
jgi:3-deoxy-manno-octulosonate cytidylyltransferase (CMP-KDO synthetase)